MRQSLNVRQTLAVEQEKSIDNCNLHTSQNSSRQKRKQIHNRWELTGGEAIKLQQKKQRSYQNPKLRLASELKLLMALVQSVIRRLSCAKESMAGHVGVNRIYKIYLYFNKLGKRNTKGSMVISR
jgi:hypothetical protein